MRKTMASSASLSLACGFVSPKLPRPIRTFRSFSATDGNILSSSLPPEMSFMDNMSSNDFRITRQISEGIATLPTPTDFKKRPLRLHRGQSRSRGRTTDSLPEMKASVQNLESSFASIRRQLVSSTPLLIRKL